MGFLENLYSNIDKALIEFLEFEGSNPIVDLYKFIHLNSEVVLDIDKEELIEISNINPNFKKLWKEGRLIVTNYPETFYDMEEDEDFFKGMTNEYFFLNKTEEECKELESDYGFFFLSKDSVNNKSIRFFYHQINESVENGQTVTNAWNLLAKYFNPCNSMIIRDRFLMQSHDRITNNLKPILNYLLPEKLNNLIFQLTIYCEEIYDIDNKVALIKEIFNEIRPNYLPPAVNIIKGKPEHERVLISNYYCISSGAGFDLFNNNIALNESTITYEPISICLDTIGSKLQNIKEQIDNIPDFIGREQQISGDKYNRLFN
jgi:hypothetical protein